MPPLWISVVRKGVPGMSKPPYRVPLMTEIAALPDNGLRVVSTFSGCGGSCLGFRMAGYRVLWANEFIPAAQETYRANHPTTHLNAQDIRKVQPEAILRAIGLKPGRLDVLEGSPPCASFSTAGKREKHWGKAKKYSDTVQRTDDLFFEYVRLVRGLQPKVFVAENVSGLVKGVAKGVFLEILKALKGCGYRVRCKVLDAQWLGVPQARQRTIFIGVRNDLGREPVFPKPLPYRYSLREALPWIVKGKYGPNWKQADSPSPTVSAHGSYNPATSHQGLELVEAVIHDTCGKFPSAGDVTDRPCPSITVEGQGQFKVRLRGGTGSAFDQKGQEFDLDAPCPTILGTKPNQFELGMERFAVGKEWDKLKPGEASEKYFNLVRPDPEAPCPTICASHGHPGVASVTHPTEKRKLSIAELKRICAFPDDFILTGTYSQQWERLGRAVPPTMMAAVARTIRDEILT
ncbi:MAG: DNA cytosine methyltransferase [Verrucomicrobiales bacterium]|nr:DNA cytosine methyltransferase [Verrucomicrobiales bacterium]